MTQSVEARSRLDPRKRALRDTNKNARRAACRPSDPPISQPGGTNNTQLGGTNTNTSDGPLETGGSNSTTGEEIVGKGTYYNTGLGACGGTNQDTDMIAALSYVQWNTFFPPGETNSNKNPVCGREVVARCTEFGEQKCHPGAEEVRVTIVDLCPETSPGCESGHLDFSPEAFQKLSNNMDSGSVNIAWSWAS